MSPQSCTVCGARFEPLEHVPTCRVCGEPACVGCMVQVNEDEQVVGTCYVCRIAQLDAERAAMIQAARDREAGAA